MKKLYSLLLVFAMAFSISACGKQPTMQELRENAEKITYTDISNNTFENIAKAKKLYCGKILEITGRIDSIDEDYFMFGTISHKGCVRVFMDANILETLEKDQQITVVGKMDEEVHTESENLIVDMETTIYTMKTAYIVTEMFDITGLIYKYKDDYLLKTSKNTEYVVYFKDGENLDALNQSIPVTVTGKIFSRLGSTDMTIKEATIKN